MLSITMQPTDLVEMRFAYSPLIELTMSFFLLRKMQHKSMHYTWVEEAIPALRDVNFDYMSTAIPDGSYIADFMTPTPQTTQYSLEDEIERLRAIPHDIISKNIATLDIEKVNPAIREHFITDPAGALEKLIAEMRLYWDRVLARHWPRIQAVLEGDVIYRAREYVLDGVDQLFTNLTPHMTYQLGEMQFIKENLCENTNHDLTGRGLQLVPTVFQRPGGLSWQLTPDWQPMLIYGARGGGLWHTSEPTTISESLEMMLGAGRARILQTLTNPLNTGELAHKLQVTAGAVSQHLGKLGQAGLVESHRSGNRVYYRLSHRGERLLNLFAE